MRRGPTLEAAWSTPIGRLSVREATTRSVTEASRSLADFYNDPHNAALLSNTVRFRPVEVVRLWRDAVAVGARPFLLFADGALAGDADFRHRTGDTAELAILVGPRDLQGKGLGGRFAVMILAIGFLRLGLASVVVAIRPENVASLRLFRRAGFEPDESPLGRSFAEEDDDVCLRLDKEAFLERHAQAIREVVVTGDD